MKNNEFYCVKCRGVVSIPSNKVCLVALNNSKRGKIPALRGDCKKCNVKLTKFVKLSSVPKLTKMYGMCRSGSKRRSKKKSGSKKRSKRRSKKRSD